MGEHEAYGNWFMVAVNAGIFIFFAISFFKPKTKRDWRTLGSFSAFVLALFVEMYGFPLTIYLLAPWLTKLVPGVDVFGHDAGHLWHTMLGMEGDPHFDPFHLASFLFIGGGFWLLAASWRVLHAAQQEGKLAETGPYARLRHPQYVAFILIMFGFLLQWPTLITLVMFPILTFAYIRLARKEERAVAEQLGQVYADYRRHTPAFIPRLGEPSNKDAGPHNEGSKSSNKKGDENGGH